MALLPKVKLKALVSFPAAVYGGAGIDVSKANGSYQFDLDYSDFAPPVSGLVDPANLNALLWNSSNESYVLSPISLFGGSGGIPEAPVDGVPYSRRNAAWTPALTDAPADGTLYARRDAAWEAVSSGGFVSLKDFGAVGDGVTNDSAARDAALAALLAVGGGTIICPKGTYLFTTGTPAYSAPILWKGEPGTVFKCVAASDITFFAPTGATVGAALTSSFNNPEHVPYVPVSNIAGLSVGDLLWISYTDTNNFLHSVTLPISMVSVTNNNSGLGLPNSLSCNIGGSDIIVNFTGHARVVGDICIITLADPIGGQTVNGIYQIATITNANQFTVRLNKGTFASTVINGGGAATAVLLYSCVLSGVIPFAINTAASTKQIYKLNPCRGGGFEDIAFDATGSTGNVSAITGMYTAFMTFKNLKFKSFKSVVFDTYPGSALMINVGYNNFVENIFADDCGSGGYNDISLYTQTAMYANDVHSAHAFGFGPGIYSCSYCYIGSIWSDRALERGIKIDQTLDSYFDFLHQASSGMTGVAIAGACCNNRFNVVQTWNSKNASFWFGDQFDTGNHFHYVIANNTFDGNDVSINTTDTGNTIDHLVTTGLIINSGQARVGNRWMDYTPTYAAFSGAFGSVVTNSAKYQATENTMKIMVDFTIAAAGSAGSAIQVTLPSLIPTTGVGAGAIYGYNTNSGKMLSGAANGASSFTVLYADGTTAIATSNRHIVQGEFRLA